MENKVREVAQMRETKRQLGKQMIYHFIIAQNKKHVAKADIRDLKVVNVQYLVGHCSPKK